MLYVAAAMALQGLVLPRYWSVSITQLTMLNAGMMRPSRELNDLEKRIDAHFEMVKDSLQKPAGYPHHVGKCLSDHGVGFEPMDSADILHELTAH